MMSEAKTNRNEFILALHTQGKSVNEIVLALERHEQHVAVSPTRVRQIVERERVVKGKTHAS